MAKSIENGARGIIHYLRKDSGRRLLAIGLVAITYGYFGEQELNSQIKAQIEAAVPDPYSPTERQAALITVDNWLVSVRNNIEDPNSGIQQADKILQKIEKTELERQLLIKAQKIQYLQQNTVSPGNWILGGLATLAWAGVRGISLRNRKDNVGNSSLRTA